MLSYKEKKKDFLTLHNIKVKSISKVPPPITDWEFAS